MDMLIGGKRVSGTKRIEVHYPYTGEIVDTIPVATAEEIDQTITMAEKGKRLMKELPIHKRVDILMKTAELLDKNKNEIASLLVHEAGKTIMDSRDEVVRTAELFRYTAEEAKRIHGETLPFSSLKGSENKVGYFVKEPVGIVVAIAPFNVPLALMAHKIAPAIAAGNTIIMKPASQTSMNTIRMGELLVEAGMPPEAVSVLTGGGSVVGDALVKDPRVRMVSFTGSLETGKRISANAGIKKLSLELGSNSAMIVTENADVDKAAQSAVNGGFQNAGQVCISVQRVFVHEKIYDEFVSKTVEKARTFKYGNPELETSEMGPVVDENNAKRIIEWINEAVSHGAKLVTGGERNYTLIPPTILIDVPLNTKMMTNELFGPAIGVRKFKKLDEAIELVNSSQYGLQAAIFTRDIKEAFKAANGIEAGGVMINEGPRYRADFMPYGGYKNSGIGREGVKFAIDEMSELKVVCFDLR
jgi:glyceraldehyde-3-phosphate dehydrogenase (NADP+)